MNPSIHPSIHLILVHNRFNFSEHFPAAPGHFEISSEVFKNCQLIRLNILNNLTQNTLKYK